MKANYNKTAPCYRLAAETITKWVETCGARRYNSRMNLRADDLLSKFGFNQGDLLIDFRWGADINVIDPEAVVDYRSALVALAQRHLAPCLDQNVVVEHVGGHNPARAVSVDGLDMRPWLGWGGPDITLTPAVVKVPDDVVWALLAEFAHDGDGV